MLDPTTGRSRPKAADLRGRYGTATFIIRAGKTQLIRVKATAMLLKGLRKRRHVSTLVTANYSGCHGAALSVEWKLALARPQH